METFNSFPSVAKDAPFTAASKEIHSDADVIRFNNSIAFSRIMGFILMLNEVVKGKEIDTNLPLSPNINQLGTLLDILNSWIDEIEPSTGPRRFGNIAFRTWIKRLEEVHPPRENWLM